MGKYYALNKKQELIRNRRFLAFMYSVACIAVLVIFSISYIYINTENVLDVESIAQIMPVIPETDEIQLVMPDKQTPSVDKIPKSNMIKKVQLLLIRKK